MRLRAWLSVRQCGRVRCSGSQRLQVQARLWRRSDEMHTQADHACASNGIYNTVIVPLHRQCHMLFDSLKRDYRSVSPPCAHAHTHTSDKNKSPVTALQCSAARCSDYAVISCESRRWPGATRCLRERGVVANTVCADHPAVSAMIYGGLLLCALQRNTSFMST